MKTVTIRKATQEEAEWFHIDKTAYILRCDPWFPKEVICGIINHKFSDTNNLGYKITGNMGSSMVSVTDINRTVEFLKKSGLTIIKN